MEKSLPPIPAKRYFTIGEVGELCDVKPHVLRYWEQEFTQLRPVKRRGNRRYYQHHEVLMIRRISDLLYSQGFTISGARNQLHEMTQMQREGRKNGTLTQEALSQEDGETGQIGLAPSPSAGVGPSTHLNGLPSHPFALFSQQAVRHELLEIRELLSV